MKMIKQRLMGVGFIAIAWFVLLLAYGGASPEDQDATATLLVGPLGLYLLYSDTYLLYDGEPERRARDSPEPSPAYQYPTTPTTTKGADTWQGNELSSPQALKHGRTPTTPSGRSLRRRLPWQTLRAR